MTGRAGQPFYPNTTIYLRVERPFTIDIGNKTKDSRSDRRWEATEACIKQIVTGEIEPQLPDGFWWNVTQRASTGSGYRETTEWFVLQVVVPVTDANMEWAMLMVMRGDASFQPIKT